MSFFIGFSCVFVSVFGGLPGEEPYLAGHAALEDGQLQEASARFAEAVAAGGPLAEFAQARLWEARWRSGDAAAEKAAWEWVHTAPAGGARNLCAARLGVYLAGSSRAEQAASLLMPLVSIDPAPWWMDAEMWEAGTALERAGGTQLPAAYDCFLKIVQRPGYVPQRNDAARRLRNSADPAHRRAAAYALFRAGGFDEAQDILKSTALDLKAPGGVALPLETWDATLAGAGATPGQQTGVGETLAANKDNPWLPLLVSRAVRLNFRAQNYDGARGLARWLVDTFPQDRDAGDSLWFLGQSLMKTEPGSALALYDYIGEKNPNHARATAAAAEVVKHWLGKGDLKQAQDAAERLGGRFPDSKYRAETYYDLAMRWRAQGDEKAAMRNLVFAVNSGPGDYFAHRALDQLEQILPVTTRPAANPVNLRVDGTNAVLQPMPGLLSMPPALPAEVDGDPRIQRARFFGRHGMEEAEWEALALASSLKGEEADGPWYLALADAGLNFTAQQWADKNKWGYDGATRTLARWRLEFPRPYFDIYQQHASALGIDPYLLLSISRQESTFRASITSRSGADGVMQLMPATARWMTSNTPGATMYVATHLASPVHSILLGANYVSQMMNKFGNNMLYAAAAYNAGPGNANKWLKAHGNVAPDEFVNIIPLEETSGYVRKVLGNYAAYRSLYPAP